MPSVIMLHLTSHTCTYQHEPLPGANVCDTHCSHIIWLSKKKKGYTCNLHIVEDIHVTEERQLIHVDLTRSLSFVNSIQRKNIHSKSSTWFSQ